MIVTGILYLIYFAVLAITSPLRLLSDVSLPSTFTDTIATASGYISSVNEFIPVDTMISVLLAMLAIEVIVLSYKLIMWVLTKIPGVSN